MTEQAISPLRRRMIEDMRIRKLAQKAQHDYVQGVKTPHITLSVPLRLHGWPACRGWPSTDYH